MVKRANLLALILCIISIDANRWQIYNERWYERGDLVTISKAQSKAVYKYVCKAYDRVSVTIPKGRKAALEAYAKGKGESVNGLINALLRAELGLSEAEWKGVEDHADDNS